MPPGMQDTLFEYYLSTNRKTSGLSQFLYFLNEQSKAEKCFDIWSILKMATVKSVEPFRISHIVRCRSKLLPLEFSKFVLVLIL